MGGNKGVCSVDSLECQARASSAQGAGDTWIKRKVPKPFRRRKRIAIFNGHAPDCSCILPAPGRRQRGLGATNLDLGTRASIFATVSGLLFVCAAKPKTAAGSKSSRPACENQILRQMPSTLRHFAVDASAEPLGLRPHGPPESFFRCGRARNERAKAFHKSRPDWISNANEHNRDRTRKLFEDRNHGRGVLLAMMTSTGWLTNWDAKASIRSVLPAAHRASISTLFASAHPSLPN